MNEGTTNTPAQEPEQNDLHMEQDQRWEAARQEFFSVVGSGIVVVYALDQVPVITENSGRRGGPGKSLPQEIGVWIHLGDTGRVTGYTGKVEVGQGIRTMLTQVIQDELPVPRADVEMVLGDTDLSPFDGGTAGSRTTPVIMPQLRRAAAATREILFDLAAQRAGVPCDSLSMLDGTITAPGSGQTFSLGELVAGQHRFKAVGEETVTRPPAEWSTPAPDTRANIQALVTGAHRYTSDLKRPGMLYGKVLRPPALNARRLSLDTSAAQAIPGAIVVQDGDFIGVVAPNTHLATQALEAIHATWEVAEGQPSSESIFEYLRNTPAEVPANGPPPPHIVGSLMEGLAKAHQVLNSTYNVAYIAHVPLEPRAAVAEWSEGQDGSRLTVWTGTQRPFGVRAELAAALGIGENRIHVLIPDTGSGYGGKHTGDAAVEAARLARGAGKPVKLVWTREEEFQWAYLRPAGVIDIRSGVTDEGTIIAWEHHNYNSGASAIRPLYDIPNQHIEFHLARSPLRQGSYRALAATANHFARESHMDDLAHVVGIDPLTFRLQNLGDVRLRAVLEAAAERFGWETSAPLPGHGFGIAGGHEKGSYVATCAEVTVDPVTGVVKVLRAVTAFECGAIVNPDNVRNQIDGAVLMGLGGALFEEIHFANGAIQNGCFPQYRLPRFSDLPMLETVLLDRKDLPSVGAGETPIVAIAPAIGNAIFQATGIRLRSLPMVPNGALVLPTPSSTDSTSPIG